MKTNSDSLINTQPQPRGRSANENAEAVDNLINTPLQRGGRSLRYSRSRFNGFSRLALLASLAIGWFAVASAVPAATNDLASTLQQGLFEEEANHNLGAAIQAYQNVVAQFDKDRKLVATAVFRLGECYRKQGKTNEAAVQYERIVQEFADQATLATLSRQNLALLQSPAAVPLPGRTDFAERLQRIIASADSAPGSATNGFHERLREIIARAAGDTNFLAGPTVRTIPARATRPPEASPLVLGEDMEVSRLQNLLKDSPDLINARDNSGNTPLHQAVGKGQVLVSRFLLDQGAEVNLREAYGRTPLFLAAKSGNKAMVEFLLSRKADPQVGDASGVTPLHEAARLGFKSIVELLLAGGAHVDARTEGGSTPLHLAARDDRKAVAETLLTQKANVNADTDSQLTPLHLAAQNGHAPLVSLLLASGADVNARDNDGATPLARAVAAKQLSLPVIRLLLAAKADPNLDFLARSDNNKTLGRRTLLNEAVIDDRKDVLEILLQNGADANASASSDGWPPLLQAASAGNLGAVTLLLQYKADPNTTGNQGRTPLHYALGQLPVAELLIKAGANVNATNWVRETPLHWAASAGLKPAAELLLRSGARINVADRNGNTPLHLAVATGRQELVQLLLDHQADVNLVNQQGQTPLDFAKGLPPGWSLSRDYESLGVEVFRLVRSAMPNVMPGGMAVPLPNVPPGGMAVPLRFPGQGPAELSDNQKAMMDALKQRGAVEDRPRPDQIQVRRSAGKFSAVVFTQGTNDWNQFSLLELVAAQYDLLSSSPHVSGGSRVPMSVLAGHQRSLAFPDFSRIRLRRPTADAPGWREQTVDLRPVVESGDCSKDVPLQWGDVVEIPEADHLLNIEWPGFSAVQITNLIKCLSRQVEIVVATPGKTGGSARETTRVTLAPKVTISPASTSPASIQGGEVATRTSFWIRSVLRDSGLLLASSDLARVKVTRKLSAGRARSWIVDCSDAAPAPDLWLRDGDVIEVPTKR